VCTELAASREHLVASKEELVASREHLTAVVKGHAEAQAVAFREHLVASREQLAVVTAEKEAVRAELDSLRATGEEQWNRSRELEQAL
jgi:uncharacterized protein YPO0396